MSKKKKLPKKFTKKSSLKIIRGMVGARDMLGDFQRKGENYTPISAGTFFFFFFFVIKRRKLFALIDIT